MMFRVIFLSGAVLLLAACVSTSAGGGSPFAETSAICDNVGIEGTYIQLKDDSKRTRAKLGLGIVDEGVGALSLDFQDNDVQRKAYSLSKKLNNYEAEIDAQYRAVTSSCKMYSRCMEQNNYREAACRSNLARWENSEREFTRLARDLKTIQAEVDKISIIVSGQKKKRKKGYSTNSCRSNDASCNKGGYQQ